MVVLIKSSSSSLNPKKTILITSLGIFLIGSVYAALKLYYKNKIRNTKSSSNNNKLQNKKIINGRPVSSNASTGNRLGNSRPYSSDYDVAGAKKSTSVVRPLVSERSILLASNCSSQNDIKTFPPEELLELGMNYLNQAIKSWETALDSIESSAYMQSQTLALPNDEHADLVFKLRTLLDKANDISINCCSKPIKPSQTLQIIQSRLAYKQQMYTEALLHKNVTTTSEVGSISNSMNNNINQIQITNNSNSINKQASVSGSVTNRYGYLSDEDDNESFVSADSDFDWLDKDLFERIENIDDKNALYEMAFSNVSLGRVGYRVSRTSLLNCKSEQDFAAKLHALRLGFDRLLQDSSKKDWFIDQGRHLVRALFTRAEKDFSGPLKNYDDFISFVMVDGDWKLIKDELATRDVTYMSFYDIVLDFILLDSFDDLDNPPSAILSVIQNKWLSQSFKETALSTAVWSVLKAKRRILKYPQGFMSRFYSVNEYLVPVLAWGFLGTDEKLTEIFQFMKNHIIDYLRCLFDLEKTRYTNLEELSSDIESHSIKYFNEIIEKIELV